MCVECVEEDVVLMVMERKSSFVDMEWDDIELLG